MNVSMRLVRKNVIIFVNFHDPGKSKLPLIEKNHPTNRIKFTCKQILTPISSRWLWGRRKKFRWIIGVDTGRSAGGRSARGGLVRSLQVFGGCGDGPWPCFGAAPVRPEAQDGRTEGVGSPQRHWACSGAWGTWVAGRDALKRGASWMTPGIDWIKVLI